MKVLFVLSVLSAALAQPVFASNFTCIGTYMADNDWDYKIDQAKSYVTTELKDGEAQTVGTSGQKRTITLDLVGTHGTLANIQLGADTGQGTGAVSFTFELPKTDKGTSEGSVDLSGTTSTGEVFDQFLKVTCTNQ